MNRRHFLQMTAAAGLSTALSSLATFAQAASGSFRGINGHVCNGTAKLEKRGDGYVIKLGSDFFFDGAPDPRIALGSGGKFAKGTDFAPLSANSGAQEYAVPANIDASTHNEIHIWCRKFSVGLAIAPIA